MGDQHDRARVGVQGLLEGLATLGVEMVRGFIEDQQVAAARDQQRELQAPTLAAGQVRDTPLGELARETGTPPAGSGPGYA